MAHPPAQRRLAPQEYADRLLATRGQVRSERRLVTICRSIIIDYTF